MRVVISVIGKDKVGILAHVATKCMEHEANVIDVTQKVLEEFFTMVMIVEWQKDSADFHDFVKEMEQFAQASNLKIHVMHEDIFNSMHSI